MNKKKSILHIIWVILKITFQAAPVSIMVVLTAGVLQSLFNVLQTVFTQRFFDAASACVGIAQDIIYSILLLGGVIVGSHVFNGVLNGMVESTSFKVSKAINRKLQEKAAGLRAEFFENAANLDCIEKARNGVEQSTFFMNVCFLVMTAYIPYFIFMGIYLMSLKPVFIAAIGMVFLPVWFSQAYRSKMYAKLEDESVVYRRKYMHYEDCIKDQRYFKETRTLGAYDYFYKLYKDNMKMHDALEWKAKKKTGIAELKMKSITLAGYIGIMLLFINAVFQGEISVGAFAALFTSINTMFHVMEELVCGHFGRLSENFASIQNYVTFLEVPEDDGEREPEEAEQIEICAESVSYRYPGSDKEVLKNLNFTIHPGETIALVGENGAGKSTLMKLLCGQYLPAEGKICFNGVDSREIRSGSLAKDVTAVFQNYQRYALTLGENVSIAGNRLLPGEERQKIQHLLAESGFDLKRAPDGLYTILSREFGGIELSGGQWQKVAIARSSYKDGKLLILDEPTAAIDPMEESRLYKLFEKLSRNRTAVIVTHRLAAARAADRIFVMDDGELAEVGTHEELIEKGGEYEKMYRVQKEMYRMG